MRLQEQQDMVSRIQDLESRMVSTRDVVVTDDSPLTVDLGGVEFEPILAGPPGDISVGDVLQALVWKGKAVVFGSNAQPTAIAATVDPGVCQGRLTLATGNPAPDADQTAKSTLYFTPYKGYRVALYNGSAWEEKTFTERSLSLSSLTADKNYDVYLYDNSGTLTLELVAWTSDSARATALATQDGVYVKTGATDRRYLGTIRTTGTTTTEDSREKRFVWNCYNRVRRAMRRLESATSWTYNSTTTRSWNNSTSNRVQFVQGLVEDAVELDFRAMTNTSNGSVHTVGIGVDSTTTNGADVNMYTSNVVGGYHAAHASLRRTIATVGFHYLQLLETGASTGTNTFYGSGLGQSGAVGSCFA